MKKRLTAVFLCLCLLFMLFPATAFASGEDSNRTFTDGSGLCEHHTQHDESCGYTEGTAEIPCSHEHNESCGGLTDPEVCNHTHDEACGYVPATEGTPCTFVCEVCNAQDSGNPATPSDAQPETCTCETLCTEEEVNADCPVCSAEGAELDKVCVGAAPMLPVTALAAAPNGMMIYVGDENVTSSGYWTTDSSGNVTAYTGGGTPTDNYIHYAEDTNTLILHNAIIKESVSSDTNALLDGAAIGVLNQNGDAELTIQLEGNNTIKNVNWGLYVLADSTSASNAGLTITGSGSLDTSTRSCGIYVQSNSGDTALNITDAEVTATASGVGEGVWVRAGDGSNISLTVDGGSLTGTGIGSYGGGIGLQFGSKVSGSGTPTVTVSNNAIVRASGNAGRIENNSSTDIQFETGSDGTGGIVWNGKDGTVYGNVILQEDLTIGEGESLTVGDGASLTVTEGKTITVEIGGKLNGDVDGEVEYPTTAGYVAPNELWVGGTNVVTGGYWITNEDGSLTVSDSNNYNVYYDGNGNLWLNNANIVGQGSSGNAATGIYAYYDEWVDTDIALTIHLAGENSVSRGYPIYVGPWGGSASLTITGQGSLNATSTVGGNGGIFVHGDTSSLTIENGADVTVNSARSSAVTIVADAQGMGTLTVDNATLRAYGHVIDEPDTSYSICFSYSGNSNNIVDGSRVLRLSGNSVIHTDYMQATYTRLMIEASEGGGGIIIDGKNGTVYGDVTLEEDLEIQSGESLTIGDGASLNTGSHEVIVNGGTLTGGDKITGTVKYAPVITTESLSDGEVGTPYTAELKADGDTPVTWSVTSGSLPAGLSLSEDGKISGSPTEEGTSTFTVTATNNIGSDSRKFTLKIEKPAFIPVTGLELNKDTLTLQEKDSDTLTATVKPADATNKDITWKGSDTNIATVSEDGTVTAISAGTATITATAKDGSGGSASCSVTVTHGNMVHTPKKDATCTVHGTEEYWTCEICRKHFKDESGTIPTIPEENVIPATGHSYGEPEWNWSEDGKTCTVTFTCEKDETHKESPEVEVTPEVKTPATCTERGVTTYTATVEFNGQTHTATKNVADIPATGHSYGEPEWNWSEDGKTCTVTFTCEKDEAHKETPEVKVTSAVKTPATCTETGVTTYTATVEFNGQTHTDTKDVADIPVTGHSYGEPEWNWTEDGKSCTVTFTCENDATHKETPEVEVTPEVKKAATCTETGVTTYTATVKFNGETYMDSKDVADIPATGHKLSKTEAKAVTCAEAGNKEYWTCETCDKLFSDAKGEKEMSPEETVIPATGHKLSKTEAKAATCAEAGNKEYWTCETCDKLFSDAKGEKEMSPEETVIPATGHKLSKTEAKAATCTEAGNKEYWTCETCGKLFSDAKGENEIKLADTVIDAKGHGTTELKNKKEATCTEEGYTGDKVCKDCGTVLEKGKVVSKIAHDYKNGKCSVCDAIDPGFKISITTGADSTWKKGSKEGLSFTSNAVFADFIKVQVDGKDLAKEEYDVKEGSTIVTLKASYLETLSVGKHTIAIVSKTGTAKAEFTVEAQPAAVSEGTDSPRTGDPADLTLWSIMFLASVGILGIAVYKRRNKDIMH